MLETNGRVETIHHENLTTYDFFNESKKDPDHFKSNAIRHIHTDSDVASLLFSQMNIDILQEGIRYSVYIKSKGQHVIGKQSETELQIVMRSIYLQYSNNRSTEIVEQVRELNSRILDFVVPTVLSEVHQYVNYTRDINFLPVPLERSKNMSTAGTKVLFMDKL